MATVTVLYHFPDLDPALEPALKVLNRRLGDSDNSLLFQEIRLKRGLSYDIYSSLDLTPQVRMLEIYCATEAENILEVLDVIQEIIRDVSSGKLALREKDLELSHKMHRTHSAALLDDTQALSGYILANALDRLPLLYYEKELTDMSRLEVSDLRQAAQVIFKKPTISMVIPSEDEE
jgi:predicted Zn-dependent peptidase